MKRFLSLTLVAIMLLSTLMLTSCDPIGSVKGFFNKIMGKEEVRTTITEMEWRNAYMTQNYTLCMQSEGMNVSIAASENAIDLDYLGLKVIVDPNTGYMISKSNGVYSGINLGEEMLFGSDFSLGAMGMMPDLYYEQLIYDEDMKAYTVNVDSIIGEFHFKNGQLTYVLVMPSDPTIDAKLEITNIGTTTVEIPEYIDLSDGKLEPNAETNDALTKITEEQLKAAFNVSNLTLAANFVIGEILAKMDEDSMSTDISILGMINQSSYYTRIDGKIYYIDEDYYTGEWVATPADEEDNIFGSVGFGELNFTLADLTYNQTGRYYELKMDGFKYYLYFANGQLTQVVMMGDAMDMGIEMEIICNISDVGTTVVTLPEYTIKEPEIDETTIVTEEIWNENMATTNYTMNADCIYGETADGDTRYTNHEVFIQSMSDAVHVSSDNNHFYVAVINDILFEMENGDDGYWHANMHENDELTNSISDIFNELGDDILVYSEFEYDYLTGRYKRSGTIEGLASYSIQIEFSYGQIYKMYMSLEYFNSITFDLVEMDATFSGIGVTSFEIPDFIIEE